MSPVMSPASEVHVRATGHRLQVCTAVEETHRQVAERLTELSEGSGSAVADVRRPDTLRRLWHSTDQPRRAAGSGAAPANQGRARVAEHV